MHKKLLRLNTDELYPARFIARVFGKYESGGSFRYFRIRKIAELPEKVLVNGMPYRVNNSSDQYTVLEPAKGQ